MALTRRLSLDGALQEIGDRGSPLTLAQSLGTLQPPQAHPNAGGQDEVPHGGLKLLHGGLSAVTCLPGLYWFDVDVKLAGLVLIIVGVTGGADMVLCLG